MFFVSVSFFVSCSRAVCTRAMPPSSSPPVNDSHSVPAHNVLLFFLYFAVTTPLEWALRPRISKRLFGREHASAATADPFVGTGMVVILAAVYCLRMLDVRPDHTRPMSPSEVRARPAHFALFLPTLAFFAGSYIWWRRSSVVRTGRGAGLNPASCTRAHRSSRSAGRWLAAARIVLRVMFTLGYVMLLWASPQMGERYRYHLTAAGSAATSASPVAVLGSVFEWLGVSFVMPFLSGLVQVFIGMSISEIAKTVLDRFLAHYLTCADIINAPPYAVAVPTADTDGGHHHQLMAHVSWFLPFSLALRSTTVLVLYLLQRRHLGRRHRNDPGFQRRHLYEDGGDIGAEAPGGGGGGGAGGDVGGDTTRTWNGKHHHRESDHSSSDLDGPLRLLADGLQHLDSSAGILCVVASLWVPSLLSLLSQGAAELEPLLDRAALQVNHPAVNPGLVVSGVLIFLLHHVPPLAWLPSCWWSTASPLGPGRVGGRRGGSGGSGSSGSGGFGGGGASGSTSSVGSPSLSDLRKAAGLLVVASGCSLWMLVVPRSSHYSAQDPVTMFDLAILASPSVVVGTCGLLGATRPRRMRPPAPSAAAAAAARQAARTGTHGGLLAAAATRTFEATCTACARCISPSRPSAGAAWTRVGISALTAVHSLRLLGARVLLGHAFVADRFLLLADRAMYLAAHFTLLMGVVCAQAMVGGPVGRSAAQVLFCAAMLFVVGARHMELHAVAAVLLAHLTFIGVFMARSALSSLMRRCKASSAGSGGGGDESVGMIQHWAAKSL